MSEVLKSIEVDGITLKEDKLGFLHKGQQGTTVALQSSHCWNNNKTSQDVKYYEITINTVEDAVAIGLATSIIPSEGVMPGWVLQSYGYHSDDGKKFIGRGAGVTFGPTFGAGETVGFGLKLGTRQVFGTLNGKLLGVIVNGLPEGEYMPTIGANAPCDVSVNFAGPFKFDVSTLPEDLVPPLRELDIGEISNQDSCVLFLDGVSHDKASSLKTEIDSVAKELHKAGDSMAFFFGTSNNGAPQLRKHISVKAIPVVVILDSEHSNNYIMPEGTITSQTIRDFIQSYKAGQLTPFKKSEDRPSDDKVPSHPFLTKLVASSFDELVINSDKDVLVDVYADWCGPCVAIAPTYAILAEALADVKNISIAKIDTQNNYVDRKYFFEGTIPNIKFFSTKNKKEPIKYEGDRTLDNFLEFIHANATTKFDLEAVKAKAKQLANEAKKKEHKRVNEVETTEEYKKILGAAKDENKLVVVDFYATWCPPCKMIAPIFADFSETYADAVFVKVNVDNMQEVSQEADIKCMPTFQLYKGGAKVGEIEGADKKELEELIKKNI